MQVLERLFFPEAFPAAVNLEVFLPHAFCLSKRLSVLTVGGGLQFTNQFAVRVIELLFCGRQKLFPIVPFANRILHRIERFYEFVMGRIHAGSQHVVQFFYFEPIRMQVVSAQMSRVEQFRFQLQC